MSTVADRVVAYARAQLGKPYKWGGEGPDSFDCSGLVHQSYLHAGYKLADDTANGYLAMCVKVSRSQLLPGMLVRPHPGHIQIYVGNGRIIEAPKLGYDVREVPMWGWLDGGFFPGTFTVPTSMPTVQFGSGGPVVMKVQRIVGVPVDGIFGLVTEAHVKEWQGAHHLAADGIVGPLTWAAMLR